MKAFFENLEYNDNGVCKLGNNVYFDAALAEGLEKEKILQVAKVHDKLISTAFEQVAADGIAANANRSINIPMGTGTSAEVMYSTEKTIRRPRTGETELRNHVLGYKFRKKLPKPLRDLGKKISERATAGLDITEAAA